MLRSIILPFVLLSLHLPKECSSFPWQNASDVAYRFTKLSSLQYGSNCSWEVEYLRQQAVKLLLSGIYTDAGMGHFNEIVANEYKMCSSGKALICDPESQKCKCGAWWYEAVQGPNSSDVVLDGDKDNMECRLNVNSNCIPIEQLPMPNAQMPKCRRGSTCKARSGEVCSVETMVKQAELEWENRDWDRLPELFVTACACVADQVEDEGVALGWGRMVKFLNSILENLIY